jgi:helicase MOV-10
MVSFTMSKIAANKAIKTTAIPFKIFVKQTYLGRCEDRAVFVFKDMQRGIQFTVTRPLYAIVGSKEEYDRLRPTMPYTPRSNTTRQPETNIVNGPPPPPSNAVRYKSRLKGAEIPSDLRSALSVGNVGQVIGRLRRSFLPSEVNGQTYAQLFKTLLWVEEYRQE